MNQEPIGKLISRISRVHYRNLGRLFKSYDLGSGGHHSYLLNILRNPGINQDQLTQHLKFDKATTTRCVKQLEEAGYIERKTDEQDRRSYLLYPTPKAEAFEGQLLAILEEANRLLTRSLDEEEKVLLYGLLKKVYNDTVE